LVSLSVNSYGLNGEGVEAVALFHRIPRKFIDDVTYVCVLNACSHSGLVDQARAIFSTIEVKFDMIYTTMVSAIHCSWPTSILVLSFIGSGRLP
jgi:pentatricopeptide repeat protein